MKLGLRIFICYFAIFIICFFFPINWVVENLRVRYLEGVEDPLVDQANILASILERNLRRGHLMRPDGIEFSRMSNHARYLPEFINSIKLMWI